MHKISITHISNAHTDWLRALDFYKQELGLLKTRLTLIASKNTHAEVLKQVEHFENQFAIQLGNISKLAHEIKENINSVAHDAASASAGFISGDLAVKHTALGSKFQTEEKIINDLRHSFNLFSAEWM